MRYEKSIPVWERTHKIILEASHKYGFNDIRFESDAEAVCMKSNYLNLTVDTVTVIGELLYLGQEFLYTEKNCNWFHCATWWQSHGIWILWQALWVSKTNKGGHECFCWSSQQEAPEVTVTVRHKKLELEKNMWMYKTTNLTENRDIKFNIPSPF